MHKNLESELKRLAEAILQTDNFNEISELHQKSRTIYEKLSALVYIDEFVDKEEPISIDESKEFFSDEVHDEIEQVVEEPQEEIKETIVELAVENADAVFTLDEQFVKKEDAITTPKETITEEKEEAQVDLFSTTANTTNKHLSLNDKLLKNAIQIGLNDRIAFVKNLFDGSQEDFNRVLSQLNSFKTESEAKSFIKKFVKPDYNWDDKQEYEERLITLIERKFL